MDKKLEFVAIQVTPDSCFSMIIERTGLPRLGANQRTPCILNVVLN